jgi:hypothetical protein
LNVVENTAQGVGVCASSPILEDTGRHRSRRGRVADFEGVQKLIFLDTLKVYAEPQQTRAFWCRVLRRVFGHLKLLNFASFPYQPRGYSGFEDKKLSVAFPCLVNGSNFNDDGVISAICEISFPNKCDLDYIDF